MNTSLFVLYGFLISFLGIVVYVLSPLSKADFFESERKFWSKITQVVIIGVATSIFVTLPFFDQIVLAITFVGMWIRDDIARNG